MENSKKNLVLFDFDGTLTRGDTLLIFLMYSIPIWRLILGAFILGFHFIVLFVSGQWSNERAKMRVFSHFFRGKSGAAMQKMGEEFAANKIPGLLKTEMLQKLRAYKQADAEICIVSASVDTYLKPFCRTENIQLICTELAFQNGVFTGLFSTPNCNGEEKKRRILAVYQLEDFQNITAFGNSKGDLPMLRLSRS